MTSHRTSPRRAAPHISAVALAMAMVASGTATAGAEWGQPEFEAPVSVTRHLDELAARAIEAARGSYLGRARAFLSLDGDMPSMPRLPDASELPALSRLPIGLRAPVGRLLAAVRTAERPLGPRTEAQLAEVLVGLRDTLAQWPAIRRETTTGGSARLPRTAVPLPQPGAEEGLLLVAAALDANIGALRAASTDLEPRSSHVSGCDLLDETPDLCVASQADNLHTQSARLVIDLGGNDVYRTSAGGAPFSLGGTDVSPIAVNVDLGGDDRYEAPPQVTINLTNAGGQTPPLAVTATQGAAAGTGLGVLVDESGSDTYTSSAPAPTEDSAWTVTTAQGAGIMGVGAVFDHGGSDHYRATAPTGKGSSWVVAQGGAIGPCRAGGTYTDQITAVGKSCWSSFGGLLSDSGGGSDTYVADAGEVLMEPDDGVIPNYGLPARGAFAQGAAWIGTGLLADDGGGDSFRVAAAANVPGRTSLEKLGAVSVAWGQGVAGFEGVAGLVDGAGPTSYEITANTAGSGMLTDVTGQGHSLAIADAFLHDGGGNDLYTMAADLDWRFERIVDDTCACDRAALDVSGRGVFVVLTGQGMASNQSSAKLHDLAGNDTYRASTSQLLDVTLRDQLTDPSAPPTLRVVQAPRWSFMAQGAGRAMGSGTLLDENGSDTYDARMLNTTRAHATSRALDGATALILPPDTPGTGVGGQGYAEMSSTGQLVDRGGEIDRVKALTRTRTEAQPDPNGAFQTPAWGGFQGAGMGGGLLLMAGDSVLVRSHPSAPACPVGAVRGAGVWRGCADDPAPIGSSDPNHQGTGDVGRSLGVVPNGPVAASPRLEFTPGTPTSFQPDDTGEASADLPRLHAEVQLMEPGGAPVADAPITIDLQRHCPSNIGQSLWQVVATTDASGRAVADLPLWRTATWAPSQCTSAPWRLFATYDGRDAAEGQIALAPMHAALALATSP